MVESEVPENGWMTLDLDKVLTDLPKPPGPAATVRRPKRKVSMTSAKQPRAKRLPSKPSPGTQPEADRSPVEQLSVKQPLAEQAAGQPLLGRAEKPAGVSQDSGLQARPVQPDRGRDEAQHLSLAETARPDRAKEASSLRSDSTPVMPGPAGWPRGPEPRRRCIPASDIILIGRPGRPRREGTRQPN